MPNLAKRDRASCPTGNGGNDCLQMLSCADLAAVRNPSTFSRHSLAGQCVRPLLGERAGNSLLVVLQTNTEISDLHSDQRSQGSRGIFCACGKPGKPWYNGHVDVGPLSILHRTQGLDDRTSNPVTTLSLCQTLALMLHA